MGIKWLFSILVLVLCASLIEPARAEVNRHGESAPLRVAFDPELIPFHDRSNGEQGFSLALMEQIVEGMGREAEYVEMSQARAVEAIQNQEVDVILTIPFSEQFSTRMEFSDSIFSTSIGMVTPVHDDEISVITDLSESLVAIQQQTIEYEFLRNIRRIQFQVTTDQRRAFELFLDGRADTFVGNMTTTGALIERLGVEEDVNVADSFLMPVDYSVAVQRENYTLLNAVNTEIRRMRASGAYGELYEEYFQEGGADGWLLMTVQAAAGVIVIFTIVLFLGIRWNRQLQHEVSKKTGDLNELNESLLEQIELKRDNNEFLNQILDSSPRGIVTLDSNGRITKFNPKANVLTGLSEAPLQRDYRDVSLLKRLLEGKAGEILAGEERRYLGEYQSWTRDDGEKFQFRYFVYPLFNFSREVAGLILTFEDVTSEMALRNKVFEQEKNQALSRVVAGIAHEIRNPLSSIKTFVELIPRKIDNQKFQEEIATYVPKEIVRVSELIEGLINYARPRHQEPETVDAGKLMHESFILFERTGKNKGMTLELNQEEGLWIEVDPQQVKQAVINLIINGLDAMEAGKNTEDDRSMTLTLSVFEQDGYVHLSVRDEGIGMADDELAKVLEPFYTTKDKGSGLGLAISSQLVKDNGGELLIVSEHGSGTTMTLVFPKKTDQPDPQKHEGGRGS